MAMNTYLIRKEWMTLGDDFVINSTEDDGEGVAYSINNKLLHLRETYHFEDPDGNVLYKIMERNVPNHRVVIYDDDEERVAVVRKRGDGTYWAMVDGDRDLFVSGDVETGGVLFSNVGGLNVARMTEAWLFAIQDMFQIDIRADQEDSLIMAVMTAVQYLAGDEGDDDDDDEERIGLAAIAFANAYLFRSVWLSIGDDFTINKIGGEDVGWYVNHKALRIRQFYHIENEDGELVYKIRERLAPNHRIVVEDADGGKVGVIRKRGDGSYWCHVDDDRDIFAEGDATEGKLELSNIGGLNVAKMTDANMKIFPDAVDMKMVLVRGDQDEALIMALLVGVQYLHEDEGDVDDDEDSD